MDHKNFKIGDVKQLLRDLADKSSSPDKIKTNLISLLNLSSENKDYVYEIVGNNAVEILVNLFNSTETKSFKVQIASVLLLLSSGEEDQEYVSDVAVIAISNICKSDLNVFIQCISGISDIVNGSSSSSSSPQSATHFLSISSSALLLEKVSIVLSSTSVKDRAKQDVLDMLLQLVGTGALKEAAEFAEFHALRGGGSGGRDGGSIGERGKDDITPAVRFFKAFAAFGKAVKEIASRKKMTVLCYAAEKTHMSIEEKKFFPIFLSSVSASGYNSGSTNLPLKFLPNASANVVTHSESKLVWNGRGFNTFFVDPEIVKGIYQLSVETNEVSSNMCQYMFGLCAKNLTQTLSSSYMHSQSNGTCAISYCGLYSGGTTLLSTTLFPSSGKVIMTLELDADKHILYFFVNGAQIPHCIINIPAPVHFAIHGGQQGLIHEMKSFKKLTAPSVNLSLTCVQYSWR